MCECLLHIESWIEQGSCKVGNVVFSKAERERERERERGGSGGGGGGGCLCIE